MIDAKLVKELREVTGAGMMDCKKSFNRSWRRLTKSYRIFKRKRNNKSS